MNVSDRPESQGSIESATMEKMDTNIWLWMVTFGLYAMVQEVTKWEERGSFYKEAQSNDPSTTAFFHSATHERLIHLLFFMVSLSSHSRGARDITTSTSPKLSHSCSLSTSTIHLDFSQYTYNTYPTYQSRGTFFADIYILCWLFLLRDRRSQFRLQHNKKKTWETILQHEELHKIIVSASLSDWGKSV